MQRYFTIRVAALVGGVMSAFAIGAIAMAAWGGTTGTEPKSTAQIAAEARVSAPDEQQAALGDGVVTDDEYGAAVDQTVACAQAAGLDASVVPANGKVPPSVTFKAQTVEEGESFRQVLRGCQTRHLDAVQEVFNAGRRPTESQQVEGWAWFGTCMRDQGVSVADGSVTQETLVSWVTSREEATSAASAICTGRHFEEFGFWP